MAGGRKFPIVTLAVMVLLLTGTGLAWLVWLPLPEERVQNDLSEIRVRPIGVVRVSALVDHLNAEIENSGKTSYRVFLAKSRGRSWTPTIFLSTAVEVRPLSASNESSGSPSSPRITPQKGLSLMSPDGKASTHVSTPCGGRPSGIGSSARCRRTRAGCGSPGQCQWIPLRLRREFLPRA
jgi:hypothetical protein